MRLRDQTKNREVRAYTLRSNVRGKGAASALRHGLSRPCTHDEGRSCPSTQTISMEANPTRIGCAPEPCRPGPALWRPCAPDPRVRTFASRHPRPGAFEPPDPDQPCAGWTHARTVASLDPAPGDPWPPGPPAPTFSHPGPHNRRCAAGSHRAYRRSTASRSKAPAPWVRRSVSVVASAVTPWRLTGCRPSW